MVPASRCCAVLSLLAAACFAGCRCVAGAEAQPASPSTLGIASSGIAVPFHIENGLLYLAGSVGGSPPLAFVVDTAATATILDPQVAAAAGYTAGSNATLLVARRVFPVQQFTLVSTGYITAISGQATAGVLGEPLLANYSLALDFDRRQAALLSPEVCPSSAARLPIYTAGALPFVEGTIPLANGEQATGLFLVDTGQPGPGIVLAAGFVAAHPALAAGAKLEVPANGGAPATSLVRLPELRLGPLTLHAPIAQLGPAGSAPDNPRLAGVLGLEALSRFNLILNRRYASLYLEPNQHTREPFEADMSGITLGVAPGQRLKIVAITPGSPAAAAHLAPGDLLLRMEDKPLGAANLGSVATALRGTPGVTVHLDIERNGRPQRVVLRLKRML